MKDTELAWLAGFIDGEACVTLHARKDRSHLSPRVTIHNTRLDVLIKISEMFACKLRVMKRNPKWKPVGQLDYRDNAAIELLKAVRPYLVLKTQQADIILSYASRPKYQGKGRSAKVPTAERNLRLIDCNAIRVLNQRGANACGI